MVDDLRRTLEIVIDSTNLTDIEALKIFEEESKKRDSVFNYIEGSDAD